MLLQISTLKFWINLEPLDYFHLIGMARGGRSNQRAAFVAEIFPVRFVVTCRVDLIF